MAEVDNGDLGHNVGAAHNLDELVIANHPILVNVRVLKGLLHHGNNLAAAPVSGRGLPSALVLRP
jgi:hypothetical protein